MSTASSIALILEKYSNISFANSCNDFSAVPVTVAGTVASVVEVSGFLPYIALFNSSYVIVVSDELNGVYLFLKTL